MNVPYKGPWPTLSDADALLMDVARRLQLTPTRHETADQNFRALCKHVDRVGSPLHGLVIECYPSGSFATGTAILSHVKTSQHDVDVVIELNVLPTAAPASILQALYEAINSDPGSRYYGRARKNSRCVTVTYEDGTTVDLMPIARLAGRPERAGHLFHHKGADQYHKEVNPWLFKEHFNAQVEYDPVFHDLFKGRRLLVEGAMKAEAETQPMPDYVPTEEKSARVVALQLLKRNRDIEFRATARKDMRKPPSIVMGAIALEAGPANSSLVDEVINVANTIRNRLRDKSGPRGVVHVVNPPHPADVFTDRWPESAAAQDLYDSDLRRLVVELHRFKNNDHSLADRKEVLQRLFGESAASYAVNSLIDSRRLEMEAGRMHVAPTGRVLNPAAVAAPAVIATTRTTAARAATREGGWLPDEDN
jgi:hypothetical protein